MTEPQNIIESFDYMHLVIPREDIENNNTDSLLMILTGLLKSKDAIIKYKSRINLSVDGYDNDTRELAEIKEVRDFFKKLDEKFPYWFYFITKESKILQLIMVLNIDFVFVDVGYIKLDEGQREDFINKHLEYMNIICQYVAMNDDEILELTNQVIEVIS